MATDVFRIQGVVELVADRAHRTLVTFQRTVVQSAGTMRSAFAGLDRAIGSFAAAFTGLQFQKLAGAFVSASIKAETFRTQLNLIIKDQQKINNLISFVEQYEAKTPFNLPELQRATVLFTKLTKVRDESISKVPEYLKLAAEMSAIFDKPLEKATEGLFKTFSGSALGLTILRNNFAITKAELQKFGVAFDNSGRIKNFSQQIDVVEQAIRKIIMNLSGMKLAEARSFTLAGRIEKLGSEVYRTARIFGDVMAPYVGTVLDRLVDLQQALQRMSPELKFLVATITGFGAAMGTLILTFGPVLYFFSMGVQGLMAFGQGAAYAGGAAGLGVLTAGLRTLLTMNIVTALSGVASLLLSIPLRLATGAGGAVAAFTAVSNAITLATFQAGSLAGGIALIITNLGQLKISATLATGLLRTGLYGVGAAAIYVLSQLQKITAWQMQANQEDENTLAAQEVKKYTAALSLAESLSGKTKGGNIGPMPVGGSASLDAESAAATAMRTPQMEATLDRVGGSKGIREQIKIIEDSRKAQQNRLGIQETFTGENWVDWLMGASKTQSEKDQQAKGVIEKLMERDPVTQKRQWQSLAKSYGFESPTPQAEYQKIKEREATRTAMNSPDFVGGAARAEEALKYYKELLPVAEKLERAFTGMDLASATARFEELKRDERLDKQSVETTVKELVELRKNGYDAQGRLKQQYAELDKKIEMEIFKYADKLMNEKHAKLEAQSAIESAKGEMTVARELELIQLKQKAIQESADQSGVLTEKMMAEYNKLYVEELKLRQQVAKERRSAEIEVTRITKGEHAAKLAMLNDETREKKKAGWAMADITKWRVQRELEIERDRVEGIREIERQITDMHAQASQDRVNAARDAAEWSYNRGGSFGALTGAIGAADKEEDQRAREARDRAREDIETRATTEIEVAKNKQKLLAAIEQQYREQQAARDQARRRRDTELEEKEQQRKAEINISSSELEVARQQTALEALREQQAQGVDVHNQIVQLLREQYQMEMAIIIAKAEAEKIGKSAEQQALIDKQTKQAVLELTRRQTEEMQKQLDMKKQEESAKKNKMFFQGGHMTWEQMQELDKERNEESRRKYENMVNKERQRQYGPGSRSAAEAASKLGVPGELRQSTIFIPPVKVEPIQINGTFTLVDAYGNKQTIRTQTSTEKKNEDTKSQTNQKGKNVL